MPTSKRFPTSKKSDTIRFTPYKEWDIPEIKNEDDEIVPKYPDSFKNIGYECKVPNTARILKADRGGSNRMSAKVAIADINFLAKYICNELIVGWYDDPVPQDEDYESEDWDEAKEAHEELFRNNTDLLGRFWSEYKNRHELEKKSQPDSF